MKTGRGRRYLIIAAAVFAAFMVSLSACGRKYDDPVDESDARKHEQIELGERYLSKLDYDNAILAFDEALKIDPKDEQALRGLGDSYRMRADAAVQEGGEGSAGAAHEDYVKAKSYYGDLDEVQKEKGSAGSSSSENEYGSGMTLEEILAELDRLIETTAAMEAEEQEPANWAEAYERELNRLLSSGELYIPEWSENCFHLFYLNSDGIPELFLWLRGEKGEIHSILLTYNKETKKVNVIDLPGVYFGYREKRNVCFVHYSKTNGDQQENRLEIYSMDDSGELELIAEGAEKYEKGETEVVDGEERTYWYPTDVYAWNGEEVSAEEYRENRESYFHYETAVSLEMEFILNGEYLDLPSLQGILESETEDDSFYLVSAAPDYMLYLDVIKDLEEEYGELRIIHSEYNNNIDKACGLLLLRLEDMDGDGVKELLAVVREEENYNYTVLIYSLFTGTPKLLGSKLSNADSLTLLNTKEHGLVIYIINGFKEGVSYDYYGLEDGEFESLFNLDTAWEYNKDSDRSTSRFYVNGEVVDSIESRHQTNHSEIAEDMRDEWLGEYETEEYLLSGKRGSIEEERLLETIEEVKEACGE